MRNINLISSTPFDYLGNMTGINYNYDTLPKYSNYSPFITKVKILEIPQKGDYDDITRQFAMADFEISTWGGHP